MTERESPFQFPSNEELRILHAINEGRMKTNSAGRYVIDGEPRPNRATREKLRKRGYIEHWWDIKNGYEWRITDKGLTALREVGFNV